jgi:membrane peptidoglycan carboxypeptidase
MRLGRPLLLLSKIAVLGALTAGVALSTAMLWALYDVPLQARANAERPSLLLEAANGEPMGRFGPFDDAVKRHDFPDNLVKAVLSIEDRRFNTQ